MKGIMKLKMNKKGQFSIIAALLVAVILVAAVVTTYSTIRYSTNAEPQILTATDETNQALKQVLGFTVGYYGSVLQVTGNSSYAQTLAANYLSSGLQNIANMNPNWASSFNVTSLSLSTTWFLNSSYSQGRLSVTYNLAGLGVYGVGYNSSCRLDVQILSSPGSSEVSLSLIQNGAEPLINLGKQSFNFYNYTYSNNTWQMVSPSNDPTTFTNGTYTLPLPTGIDSSSYLIQVKDARGIVVVASSFNQYSTTFTWNASSVPGGHYVDTTANVDSSTILGTHSSFSAQQSGPDGTYDTVSEALNGQVTANYNVTMFKLLNSTLISGTTNDLKTSNGQGMTFESIPTNTSAQTLFAHQESTSIVSTSYYLLKNNVADTAGTTVTKSMTSSRVLFGKFVYSLQGISSIAASTWTVSYRAWSDPGTSTVAYDQVGSGDNNAGSATITWSHTTGSGANRIMIVGVSIRSSTVTVQGIAYGSQSLTFLRSDYNSNSPVRTELWYLVAPVSGTQTITVTLQGFGASTVKATGGSCSYSGVSQTAPVAGDASGANANSNNPSVTLSVANANSYLVGVIGMSTATSVSSEGSSQTMRWDQTTAFGSADRGHGSDKGPVGSGSQSMSWTLSGTTTWAASVVAIKPAIVTTTGNGSVDILIRQSTGVVRSTIATDVAISSAGLTSSAATVSGTYAWSNYNVVSQTDYLEVDYYVDVLAIGSQNAYLRIDDNTLATNAQTRVDNLIVPNQYTVFICSAEFSGTSDLNSWNSLTWSLIGSATSNNIDFTSQLYNYATTQYPTSGDGYSKTIMGTSMLPVVGVIATSPTNFRNSTGGWKLMFNATQFATPFNVTVDLVNYSPALNTYALSVQEQWINVDYSNPNQNLCIYAGNLASETLLVDVWHGNKWNNVFAGLVAGWNNVSVTLFMDSPTFTIRLRDSNPVSDLTPSNWGVDAALLVIQPDLGMLQSVQDGPVMIELLQNGTMRWLGQNLRVTTQSKPIPPIPVKSLIVNQTINGVTRQVPFQIEDWASLYQIPLGLTSNFTVFGNNQMIVFPINATVTKVTIWWNGSDTAIQTRLAYTNNYFKSDNPAGGTLSNGRLTLTITTTNGNFYVTSAIGSPATTSTAYFMRINNDSSTYGASPAYVIHHGIVRDIIQQEAEWTNGPSNGNADSPNVYSQIVLTLPAGAAYYTYQLRTMFINSTQTRTISDLCPITLTSSVTTQAQTENGTSAGLPIVASGSGTFYNLNGATSHHWSQFISNSKGAGIMFTDAANQQLNAFDALAGKTTGAIDVSSAISLLPVTPGGPVQFGAPWDLTWNGAVVTFDGSATPVYKTTSGNPTGLWILVEYEPTIAVTTST